MHIGEIESALKELSEKAFNAETFFFDLMEAFGAPVSTVKRLKDGSSGKSDVEDAFIWKPRAHCITRIGADIQGMLDEIAASKKTGSQKIQFLIATDGEMIGIRNLKNGASEFIKIADLGFNYDILLPLGGFELYEAVHENPVDVKAAGRLAKLYDGLTKANPEWAKDERRHDMSVFLTRLIFCLFAEDTGIFEDNIFTQTITNHGGKHGEEAGALLERMFEVMDTATGKRGDIPSYLAALPYVNGGLFAGSKSCPEFSQRTWQLLREAADLDWKEINPDIFGSMIQAVVDPAQRGELGMHYTSVPNIMKVLGPLFLDDYKAEIGKVLARKDIQNKRKRELLHEILGRLSALYVFDPACGSGNFLVTAYKQLRAMEMGILKRCEDLGGDRTMELMSRIQLSHFRGIEIDDFAAETAKLAMWIAEYQMNCLQREMFGAMENMLPLKQTAPIRCGNALRVEWEEVCPSLVDQEAETYIAGNPPFLGSVQQTKEQKSDLKHALSPAMKSPGALDFVAGWFFKSGWYVDHNASVQAALVSTNSVCQGQSVGLLWPHILNGSVKISFARTSFPWKNNASHNAGVTCVIVGLAHVGSRTRFRIFAAGHVKDVENISPYLLPGDDLPVQSSRKPTVLEEEMVRGNQATDGGNLILSAEERRQLLEEHPEAKRWIKRLYGSQEFIKGLERYCLWIFDEEREAAETIPDLAQRIAKVRRTRLASRDAGAHRLAERPHQFREMNASNNTLIIPRVTSEHREWLQVGYLGADSVVSDRAFQILDAPIYLLSILSSRLHRKWIATVCGKLKTDLSYSNTLGWNTFPMPTLTEDEKARLEQCANDILDARDLYPLKTIAELYDPEKMPAELRAAHEANDEVLEKIYIGRKFRNDTERLEHLFARYSEMIANENQGEA